MVAHEEVTGCYKSWEFHLKKLPGLDCFIQGPKSPTKIVKLFEISEAQWPTQSTKVPEEPDAFVRFIVHVSRWKRRNLYPNTNGVNGRSRIIYLLIYKEP